MNNLNPLKMIKECEAIEDELLDMLEIVTEENYDVIVVRYAQCMVRIHDFQRRVHLLVDQSSKEE